MNDQTAGDEAARGREGSRGELTRRVVLQRGGAVALAVMVARGGSALGDIAVAVTPGRHAFLSERELSTLRGLVDRFVPGKPEDSDPGALAAGCAGAIDALLGAFRVNPPLIYAGAPFSDRAGSRVNHFEDFLPLDAYERKAWRLRIKGSRGRTKLEFNGPVKGFQAIYREGLAALDAAAGPAGFGELPAPAREAILRTSNDSAVGELIDVAFPHTLGFMYGAPEYGGNRDLIGWKYTSYDGDVQPRGYTREQIEQPDPGATDLPGRLLDSPAREQLIALAPLGSPEVAHDIVARAGGRLSGLEAQVRPILDAADGGLDGA